VGKSWFENLGDTVYDWLTPDPNPLVRPPQNPGIPTGMPGLTIPKPNIGSTPYSKPSTSAAPSAAPPATGPNDPLGKLQKDASGNGTGAGATTADGLFTYDSNGDKVPNVFMGAPHPQGYREWPAAPDVVKSVEDVVNEFSTYSTSHRRSIARKLYAAGLIKNVNDWDEVEAGWKKVVIGAAKRYAYSGGSQRVTPYDMIDVMGSQAPDAGGTQTAINKSITKVDDGTANDWVRTIFSDAVGRAPSGGELSKYRGLITGYYRDHPTTTKSTTVTDAKGNTSTTNEMLDAGPSEPGAKEGVKAGVQGTTEYGSYQAATTFFNALMRAVAGQDE
jgi:hypothetical protein